MAQQHALTADGVARKRWLPHFWRHFIEMNLAMIVGMMVGGALFGLLLAPFGMTPGEAELRLPELSLVVMGVNMAVPMAVWMRVRRHPWSRSIEMGGAMFAPGIPLLVLFWFGVLAYGAVCGVWCATMIAAMLALMLYRRSEYVHGNMR